MHRLRAIVHTSRAAPISTTSHTPHNNTTITIKSPTPPPYYQTGESAPYKNTSTPRAVAAIDSDSANSRQRAAWVVFLNRIVIGFDWVGVGKGGREGLELW